MTVRIQKTPIDVSVCPSYLNVEQNIGAVAQFTGIMRRHNQKGAVIVSMDIEHYHDMVIHQLEGVIAKACAQWPLGDVAIVHRVGRITPGEVIVWVGVASAHRKQAFLACAYLMDYLKTDAPLWKQEITADGEESWIAPSGGDGHGLSG